MSHIPNYKYEDFKKACKNKKDVFIWNKALGDAKKCFGLKSRNEVLSFIANNGLEDLNFKNSKPWENNPNKDKEIFVDAYEFNSLNKSGYIAFFYNDITKKWTIKSFKFSDKRNDIMRIAIEKANLQLDDEGENCEK